MIKATTKSGSRIVREEAGKIFIDDSLLDWEVNSLPDGRLQIFSGNRVYSADINVNPSDPKSMTVVINGHSIQVDLKTALDLRLEQMGMDSVVSKVKQVVSPMPGLITAVKVAEGQSVIAGTPLLVLEAMKMENVLQASGDAEVKHIKVKKGDRVEKGQILIEF